MAKARPDGIGLGALVAVALRLAFDPIIVNCVNGGLQAVVFAGLRPALAAGVVAGRLWYRSRVDRVRWAACGDRSGPCLPAHVIFGELLSPSLIGATALVSCGPILINHRVYISP